MIMMCKKELKTLKDLDLGKLVGVLGGAVAILDLRQEAIKWIKSDLKEAKTWVIEGDIRAAGFYLINKWMERLNLTDEDLKDGK